VYTLYRKDHLLARPLVGEKLSGLAWAEATDLLPLSFQTRNIVAFLNVTDDAAVASRSLKVRSPYPPLIAFSPERLH
jgi:hypothetical protein